MWRSVSGDQVDLTSNTNDKSDDPIGMISHAQHQGVSSQHCIILQVYDFLLRDSASATKMGKVLPWKK